GCHRSQSSWTIELQGGGAPVAQGSGYASNATLAVPICLPNGNYVPRVLRVATTATTVQRYPAYAGRSPHCG
ncbi:MAG: hypothetical protein IPN85_18300, partial [Flavobacteriales bacterium]|nr:hypothetical protein [Flavobacteriales bacterium]